MVVPNRTVEQQDGEVGDVEVLQALWSTERTGGRGEGRERWGGRMETRKHDDDGNDDVM